MIQLASKRNLLCLEKGKLIIGYLVAGYPEKDGFAQIINHCESAGLDVFEIGYPSGNPVADGEVIKRAHGAVDLRLQRDIGYWRELRDAVTAPIWIMAYCRDLIDTGFYRDLAENGLADAFVIPDMTMEHRLSLMEELRPCGADVLGFVTPDMKKEEQEACFKEFPLVYQQLYSGPTGMPVKPSGFEEILARGRAVSEAKAFAGFGINTSERASQLLSCGFDGVIIGTAMMSKLNESEESLLNFVRDLSETVKEGR
jgi:tryptophan synthase alpha chain